VLTRQEKEKLVIDLYNQGMTIRDIAKELRISFRDIGVILKRASGEIEEKQEKEKPSLSPSSQAYRLFSEGKELIEVAIALNLSESETTKYYEEYLNLKQMDDLQRIYEEIGPGIMHFLVIQTIKRCPYETRACR
jgi:DNA-binding NarL/FixJ family response regulator